MAPPSAQGWDFYLVGGRRVLQATGVTEREENWTNLSVLLPQSTLPMIIASPHSLSLFIPRHSSFLTPNDCLSSLPARRCPSSVFCPSWRGYRPVREGATPPQPQQRRSPRTRCCCPWHRCEGGEGEGQGPGWGRGDEVLLALVQVLGRGGEGRARQEYSEGGLLRDLHPLAFSWATAVSS